VKRRSESGKRTRLESGSFTERERTNGIIHRMCGICGIVRLGAPPETAAVEAMAAALDHRGPDGKGSFAADGVVAADARA